MVRQHLKRQNLSINSLFPFSTIQTNLLLLLQQTLPIIFTYVTQQCLPDFQGVFQSKNDWSLCVSAVNCRVFMKMSESFVKAKWLSLLPFCKCSTILNVNRLNASTRVWYLPKFYLHLIGIVSAVVVARLRCYTSSFLL